MLAWFGWMGEQMRVLIWLALYVDKTIIKTIIKINVKSLSCYQPARNSSKLKKGFSRHHQIRVDA
jgi:hypothetical protein